MADWQPIETAPQHVPVWGLGSAYTRVGSHPYPWDGVVVIDDAFDYSSDWSADIEGDTIHLTHWKPYIGPRVRAKKYRR